AEDGIRDDLVTGVQTCALPIWRVSAGPLRDGARFHPAIRRYGPEGIALMELRHLRYFVAVAEEGSFLRAGRRLRVAQPALSKQIRDLEREVGVKLFERLPRGARVTPAGEHFLRDTRNTLESAMRAVATDRRADCRSRPNRGFACKTCPTSSGSIPHGTADQSCIGCCGRRSRAAGSRPPATAGGAVTSGPTWRSQPETPGRSRTPPSPRCTPTRGNRSCTGRSSTLRSRCGSRSCGRAIPPRRSYKHWSRSPVAPSRPRPARTSGPPDLHQA